MKRLAEELKALVEAEIPQCVCDGDACKVRTRRGLVPFCQIDTKTIRTVRDESYPSYREAAKHLKSGERVVSGNTSGSYTGSAREFFIIDKKGKIVPKRGV